MTEISQTSCAIVGLVSRFVEKPDALKLEMHASPGGDCYWMLKGDPKDDSKLIGKSGAHVNALTFLLAQLGQAAGHTYSFRLFTEDTERRGHFMARAEDPMTYDVEPTRALLESILEMLLAGEFAVQAVPSVGAFAKLTFDFNINLADPADREDLQKTKRLVIAPATRLRGERSISMTTLDAIKTLFEAIANTEGVWFQINVEAS